MTGNTTIKSVLRILAFIALAFLNTFCSEDRKPEIQPAVKEKVAREEATNAGKEDFEVGTGWGEGEATVAIHSALQMALEEKSPYPDLVIIHPTAGSDCAAILREARQIVGRTARIYGGTSDARGVVSDRRYVTGAKAGYSSAAADIKAGHHGLAVMTIKTRDIVFGVGSASLTDYGSPQELGAAAVRTAILDAGKELTEKPDLILVTPTIGIEQEVLEGIRQTVGNDAVLLGGTAGGPEGMVFGNEQVYRTGVSLVLMYTDLPIGWTFESGFEKPDEHSGVVTKMDAGRLVEIDHKPAYEVYDGWLGGEVTRLRRQGEKNDILRDFLSLHPLFRKRQATDGRMYTVFSHPWAPDKNLLSDGLYPTGDIREGDRVYLSYGTWEVLMNRIGNLPQNARSSVALDENAPVLLGIGTICGGVLGVIPREERDKFPILINNANNNAPFIASITWGEQGSLPGVGYQHCNLTTSFLVIGGKK